jgi:sec-independent protein translocase protein TatB
MREAEMADLKKSFDEVREAASGLSGGKLMTRLVDTLGEPPKLEGLDKPAADTPAASAGDIAASGPTPPEAPIPETFTEADANALASEPLAITREFQDATPAEPAQPAHEPPGEAIKDAKAS